MPTRISRPLTAALLIGAVAATVSACSSGSSPSSAPSSPARTAAPVASTADRPTGPAGAALAAYAAMWKDVAEAITTDDYQASYLSDHLARQALVTITDNMAADKKQGIVGRGAPVLHPVVTSATASTVAITDCLSDQAWLEVRASTGALVNDVPGGFRSTTATVTDENGIWKVTQLNTGAEGTCHISSPTG